MKQRRIHEHCLCLEIVNFYPEQSHLRCDSWLRLQLLENFYFHGTLAFVFLSKLTFCKSAAVINHKFQGYADTSQYSEAVPQRCSANMQRIYRRTSMHMCGFHKFEQRVWVFSKFAAYLQDTILPFCQKTSGGLFLNILFIVFTANFQFHQFCNTGKRELACLYFSQAN